MHPYLNRLGVPQIIQNFFEPWHSTDAAGNLVFDYGGEMEKFAMAYHKIPAANRLWLAGDTNHIIQQIMICYCSMDAIAYAALNQHKLAQLDRILFASTGSIIGESMFNLVRNNTTAVNIIGSNDLISRAADVKIAALLSGKTADITLQNEIVRCVVQYRHFNFPVEEFSLSAFEKKSGYRLGCRTFKPHYANSWMDQLCSSFRK